MPEEKEEKKSKKSNLNIFAIVATAIFVGGVAFFGGMKYQESKLPTSFRQFAGRGNFNPQDRGANGNTTAFRPVNGEILSIDNGTITVKMSDGSSHIVILNDQTTYSKTQSAQESDLKVGDTIIVFGTNNSDGSVTAQNIQLNPEARVFGEHQPTP